jgi:NitT/TauT family transport system substrate-binding protein
MTQAWQQRIRVTAASAILAAGLFAQAAPATADEAVSVRLKWLAQAQFAGFYVAEAKGYYAEEGIDITINPGGPNLNAETLVASGADQFAVAGSMESVLASREKGLPILAIGMMLQHTPTAYVAFADSGIVEPADFAGKRVSTFFSGAHHMLYAILAENGITEDDVDVVPQAVTMAPFTDRQVDVATVMVFNELNVLRSQGIDDINLIHPWEHGVNVPTDALIVNETFMNDRPEVVQGFLNASLRGWKYAIENVEEAVDIVMEAAPGLARDHQIAMLKTYGELMLAGRGADKGLGYLDPEFMEQARQLLVARNADGASIEVSSAIEPSFWNAVPDAYKKP